MLVLTRRVGESIRIGADIVVHIVNVEGNQIRIGVEAPKEVRILRSELSSSGDSASDARRE